MPDTETARIALDDSGVVVVRIRNGAQQSLAEARENLAVAIDQTKGQRRPVLIDIRHAQALDAEARHHYSGQILSDHFSALGLLVEASPLGRMIGNVYLRIARPGVPTQLFTGETEALEWLSDFRI
jgi:hypothetical protein